MATRQKGDSNVVDHPAAKKAATKKAAAKPANRAAADITLPPLSEFDKIVIPDDVVDSFVRQQGEGKEPRKFSAKGAKADACKRVIFANKGFTRQQIADIVDCSASRVTEIFWAIEASHSDKSTWEMPVVPRGRKAAAKDDEPTEAEAKSE